MLTDWTSIPSLPRPISRSPNTHTSASPSRRWRSILNAPPGSQSPSAACEKHGETTTSSMRCSRNDGGASARSVHRLEQPQSSPRHRHRHRHRLQSRSTRPALWLALAPPDQRLARLDWLTALLRSGVAVVDCLEMRQTFLKAHGVEFSARSFAPLARFCEGIKGFSSRFHKSVPMGSRYGGCGSPARDSRH